MILWSYLRSFFIGILSINQLESPEASIQTKYQEPSISLNDTSLTEQMTYPYNFLVNQPFNDEQDNYVSEGSTVIKTLPDHLSESFDGKEFDMRIESLYNVHRRSKRDISLEYLEKNSVTEIEMTDVCTFDLNVKNYMNVKYDKQKVSIDLIYREIFVRSLKIASLASEKSFLEKTRRFVYGHDPKCKELEDASTDCILLKIDEFLQYSSKYYSDDDENRETSVSFLNDVECLRSSYPDWINRNNVICNSSKFYAAFKQLPIFNITDNKKLSRLDHLPRQVFAVITMLYEEITTSKALRRYLYRNKYRRLIKTIKELYKCVNDINYFESLYNDYSSFSGQDISDKKYKEKVNAARFFDYIAFNLQKETLHTEDILRIVAYLEKRRLIYNIHDFFISYSSIDISTYLHVIISFTECFKQ